MQSYGWELLWYAITLISLVTISIVVVEIWSF